MGKYRNPGPGYERPVEEPDFIIDKSWRHSEDILSVWVQSVKDERNAVMLYAYDNEVFNKDKASSLVLDNGYLKFKHLPESNIYVSWGGAEESRIGSEDIIEELKRYIDREFEKEVLGYPCH